VTARRQSERACAAQRRSGKREPREGHTSCVCPYVGIVVVSWTGGIQVSTRRNEGRQRTLATRLRGYACAVGSATQGARRRAFGRVCSANRADGARLHHRAPYVGIPAGVAIGGSRAADSVNTTLHGTRRRCDGSRR
jgi:hypothetical protein